MTDNEIEDLDNLLKSPGWLRFTAHVREEWSVGFSRKVKGAIQKAREERRDLGEAVAAVDSASDEVNAMLSWPQYRLTTLQAREWNALSASVASRGGL